MRKLILFVICLVISLSLADNKKTLKILDTGKSDVIEMFDVDSDKENNDGQRKRDSGYSYRRPHRPIKFETLRLLNGPGRYVTRLPANNVKPFNRYGPPKQTALHVFLNNHQKSRPQNQRHKNRYHHGQHSNDNDIQFPDNNELKGNLHLNLLNPIEQIDALSDSNPIASQNIEPFNHNAANYLPPKNQKLPIYSSNMNFQQPLTYFSAPQRFNTDFESQKLIQNSQSQSHPLSDATKFLTQNAQAISQLYETPATNINYAPVSDESNDSPNNESPDPNSQFQTFDIASTQQLQQQLQQNSEAFTGQIPPYSSGIIRSYTLEKLIAEEKNRLIAQLQQALTTQSQASSPDVARYAQNYGNYYETQKLLDKFQNQGHPGAFKVANTAIEQTSIQHATPVTSYGVPVRTVANQTPATISLTASTASDGISIHQSQTTSSTTNSHVPTLVSTPTEKPPVTFPFSQYGSFVPTIIGDTNFASGLPPHYGSTFAGTNPSNSPTHFSIPIGTTVNKPILGSVSPIPITSKPIFPLIPSSLPVDHPTSIPISPVHPILTNPIQPTFPIAPILNPLQKPTITSHPPYGIQPTPINSVILRPVKPVYPVYYFPNTAYQFQKPALSLKTYPGIYSTTHLQTKLNQSWK